MIYLIAPLVVDNQSNRLVWLLLGEAAFATGIFGTFLFRLCPCRFRRRNAVWGDLAVFTSRVAHVQVFLHVFCFGPCVHL